LADVVREHIGKSFGNVVAVDDVSMRIEDEGFVALLGPSGCGKTTTLRLIAGLHTHNNEHPLGDKLVVDLSPRDRNIAMVFQSHALSRS
jgi:multiple sugar transport system ATP-binding protein